MPGWPSSPRPSLSSGRLDHSTDGEALRVQSLRKGTEHSPEARHPSARFGELGYRQGVASSELNRMKPKIKASIRAAVVRMDEEYGNQGWWPVQCERKHFTNPTGELELDGYHPEQFDFPRTRRGRWEICCGAVLTQNTAWTNVRRALAGLVEARLTTPELLLQHPCTSLSAIIRPAGYFNQKANYLRTLAEWFIDYDPSLSKSERSRTLLDQARAILLDVKGVGRETADCILLYAYSLPTFVVDAYTRRVFARLGVIDSTASYESIRAVFEECLAKGSIADTVRHWQQAHALIVEHAKRYHGRGTDHARDFLLPA